MILQTDRTIIRPWRDADRDDFAAMHADPEVIHDYPAPFTRAESDAKLDRYAETYSRLGFARMALTRADGAFLGYVGIMPIREQQVAAIGPGVEIGWRMVRAAWGFGYVTEASRAVLDDGFSRCGFRNVLSYTENTNQRSQAVMTRLGLTREPARDFKVDVDAASRSFVVFVAYPETC